MCLINRSDKPGISMWEGRMLLSLWRARHGAGERKRRITIEDVKKVMASVPADQWAELERNTAPTLARMEKILKEWEN